MPDTALNKQQVAARSVTGGTFAAMDVDCSGRDTLTIQAQGQGAAVGDWTLAVIPYQGDGNTLQPVGLALPSLRAGAPAFAGGKVNAWAQYDVQGFDKVQVRYSNTTGGALIADRISANLSSSDS